MVSKVIFALIVSTLLVIQSSTSSPIENDILVELTNRLDRLHAKMEADNEKWTASFDQLQAENAELRVKNSKQDEEIALLKRQQISSLKSSLGPYSISDSHHYETEMKNGAAVVDGPSLRATTPPSTCQEVADNNGLVPLNGIYLLKNNKKMQAVYCQFKSGNPVTVTEQLIGNVDVKTETVHFYVQRNSSFSTASAIIPFELSRLNEGGAMDLTSGTFTAPVDGIYHFQLSAVKDTLAGALSIWLNVNGDRIGIAITDIYATGTYNSVSLSASLRLKAKDRVNLYNENSRSAFYDNSSHHWTHFTGWLVEEDLI